MRWPWPFARSHTDPVVNDYLARTPRRPRGSATVDEVSFVVLDAETTGFDTSRDRMLSLATLTVQAGAFSVSASRSWLVRQPAAPLSQAVAVHGILPSETASGMDEAAVLRELLPVLSGAIIVGHHVRFDASMIHGALRRHFGIPLRNPLVDTARLAMGTLEAFRKSGYANQHPPTLDEVCALCGVDMMDRHTAVGDAFTTAEVFLLLAGTLRRRVLPQPLRLHDLTPVRF